MALIGDGASVMDRDIVDVAVIGGGPAGLAAAGWAARYRRRVLLVNGGQHRNGAAAATHGYLGLEGASPGQLLHQARAGLDRYPELEIVDGVNVDDVTRREPDGFDLVLGDGSHIRALRLVLATGVRDVFPDIEAFDDFYGTSVFTCPSCDGYEAQGKAVAVLGDDEDLTAFSIGLLEWADSVTLIRPGGARDRDELAATGVRVVNGVAEAFVGEDNAIQSIRLAGGSTVDCEMVFFTTGHVQRSDLASRLGCEISAEGCVVVDDHGRTSVPRVFAAGDMTPGPHLVQVAAAEGAIAGIAAAMSLRGERGAPTSSQPAPDAEQVLARIAG